MCFFFVLLMALSLGSTIRGSMQMLSGFLLFYFYFMGHGWVLKVFFWVAVLLESAVVFI